VASSSATAATGSTACWSTQDAAGPFTNAAGHQRACSSKRRRFSDSVKALINDTRIPEHEMLEQLRRSSASWHARRRGAGLTEVGQILPSWNAAIASDRSSIWYCTTWRSTRSFSRGWTLVQVTRHRPETSCAVPSPNTCGPIPNVTRFPTCASAALPPGAGSPPEHPDLRPPGSPCSYTPANPAARHRLR